ncbi:MAG: hypothetical protein SFZ03_07785 [Candidatus Melainabacteria bacterium]|nr:hypothetical protein [Candidatus Melainabacteria bacterium]
MSVRFGLGPWMHDLNTLGALPTSRRREETADYTTSASPPEDENSPEALEKRRLLAQQLHKTTPDWDNITHLTTNRSAGEEWEAILTWVRKLLHTKNTK